MSNTNYTVINNSPTICHIIYTDVVTIGWCIIFIIFIYIILLNKKQWQLVIKNDEHAPNHMRILLNSALTGLIYVLTLLLKSSLFQTVQNNKLYIKSDNPHFYFENHTLHQSHILNVSPQILFTDCFRVVFISKLASSMSVLSSDLNLLCNIDQW